MGLFNTPNPRPDYRHAYSHCNTLSSAAMTYAVTSDPKYLDTIVNAHDWFQRTQVYATGGFGKLRPVGAELKFHGDAGNDAEGEADAEDFGPEAGGVVPDFIFGAEGQGFENEDQKRQAHRKLRENVVEGDGEGEVETMDG